jgi:V8-like Glu-specific endopeptidase
MGWARAVQVDFTIGALPGRIYVASPSDRTYSVMCFAATRDALPKMRRAAETIATSMRWAPMADAPSPGRAADDLDARRAITDARTELPAIGLLTGGGSRCTAFLAGSDRVLVTAAHCVLNEEGKPKTEQFDFQPGYTNGRALGTYRATLVTNGEFKPPADGKATKELVLGDWAVLTLDRPAGVAPLALVRDLPSSTLADKSIQAFGYSTDIENGRFLTQDACKVTAVEGMRIEHSCRGARGASGGPIFLANPDGTRGPVVAVNVQESASRTSERLVIRNIRALAGLRTLPELDFGGRAVYAGAFLNAVKLMGGGGFASAR